MTNTYYISPDDQRFDYLPAAYNGTSPLCESNCERFGWKIMTEEVEDEQLQEMDDTEFKKACALFRDVCRKIGAFIGDENFKGGFEDYAKFINSSAAKSSKASASLLASMWSGANEYLKYEGEKYYIVPQSAILLVERVDFE